MPNVFMGQYPRIVKFKIGQSSYPGCVAVMREPGSGTIIYIPTPVTGNNQTISLFETVTIANSEIEAFAGGVVLRATADPAIVA